MKSSLALIAAEVSDAIALELGERPLTDVDQQNISRTRTIAGVRVRANTARDAAIDETSLTRLKALQSYRVDEQVLVSRLKDVGVTPLATLPLPAWEKLLDMTGLYRFIPDKDGKVGISSQIVDHAREEARSAEIEIGGLSPWWIFLLIPASSLLSILLYGDGAAWFMSALLVVIPSLFGYAYISAGDDGVRSDKRKKLATDLIRQKVLAATENGTIYSLLWPDFKSPKKAEAKIAIGLPDPTPEAATVIVAVERTSLHMQLAVVGEAIHLLEDPAGVLLKEQTRQIEMERRLADPIVYVVKGEAVAIVAQYGEFPIEQEVVSEVVGSVHLI